MNNEKKELLILKHRVDGDFDYDLKEGSCYTHREAFEHLPTGETGADTQSCTIVDKDGKGNGYFKYHPHYTVGEDDPMWVIMDKKILNQTWKEAQKFLAMYPESCIVIYQLDLFYPEDKEYPHFAEFVEYLNGKGLDLPEKYKRDRLIKDEQEKMRLRERLEKIENQE